MSRSLKYIALLMVTILVGCASPPKNPENICDIFDDKRGWRKDAEQAAERWGASIPVMMAIMYQESSYQDDAKPPRASFVGIPMWWRVSDAYGYAQAKDATWEWYEEKSGNNGDRDDFDDAIDFIAWYNSVSNSLNGISHEDANSLYLAYHEGHGGFSNQSYKSKGWLISTAARVQERANRYRAQLASCS